MKNRYSKEEIQRANSYSLPDLLRMGGYILVPDRRGEYHLQEHDSLKISEHNGWKWFSQDIGGKNIDFFMQYENLDFLSAVERIFSIAGEVLRDEKEKIDPGSDHNRASDHKADTDAFAEKPFVMPPRNDNDRRAYAYLVKTRCLDPKLVSGLMKSGHLYEAAGTHNAVFLGTNYEGNIVSAFERGTGPRKFARDTAGSSKSYRFRIVSPGSDKLNIFEAEIDLLSYISMNGLKNENYIALGGRSSQALNAFLKESGIDIKSVNLCLDNDEVGNKASESIKRDLEGFGNYNITRDLPKNKDFNEDLQMLRSAAQRKEREVDQLCEQEEYQQ